MGGDGPGDAHDWFCGDVFNFFISQHVDLGREVVVPATVAEVVKKTTNEQATAVLVLDVEETAGDVAVADRICICRDPVLDQ